MSQQSFREKWQNLRVQTQTRTADEKSLFVDTAEEPQTQRQLNLYWYFAFVRNILQGQRDLKVLEVGCGRGTLSLYLAKYLGYAVWLLDDEKSALELARQDFQKHHQKAEFLLASALKTGLPNDFYDAVVSIGLAEHFNQREVVQLFQEQYRVLRKGGVMISLNLPQKFSIQFLNQLMRLEKKIFGHYQDPIKKDYFRNQLKPQDYKLLAQQVGFVKVKTVNVCPFAVLSPITMATDKKITAVNKFILKIRGILQKYPYKTNYFLSQGHFLVAEKDL